ncbi:MAG: molybdopterin-guanine dinucleotide biosynthesis protein B [Gammaproteobacteria bacterium]|nr:molybdopterin-guanine dinucleotide biosynthesis protein B [Gammaproteobacteria bacterium]
MLSNATVPVVGFVAPSGTGKTQLLKALITRLKSEGFKVAAIKHSHHDFEIDKPGKDSYELRMSGATQVLIASKHRWAMISENEQPEHEVALNTLLKPLDQATLDIILIEGFKFEHFPKIEVYRAAAYSPKRDQEPMFLSDPDIIAVATDTPLATKDSVTLLDINDIKQISQFIIQHFSLNLC